LTEIAAVIHAAAMSTITAAIQPARRRGRSSNGGNVLAVGYFFFGAQP
jgi:hypothetical protein